MDETKIVGIKMGDPKEEVAKAMKKGKVPTSEDIVENIID